MMSAKARRLPSRCWLRITRRALPMLLLWLGGVTAPMAQTGDRSELVRLGSASAWFENATDRYGHAIMGDLPEWGRLCLELVGETTCVTLPNDAVFEDIAPRLADLDGDAVPDMVVVESTLSQGAALAVYRLDGQTLQRIATPPIGRRNRWLAPAAVADLDGDGAVEIAYVDRPHLAKRLRIWRFQDNALTHVADADGLTNHRIGDEFITGGLRTCAGGPEIILVDANWRRIMSARLVSGEIETTPVANYSGTNSIRQALHCDAR